MAFIILGDREQEWERRPLRQAITIGRSFDCELPVRDTLLSRQHCRLEPHGNQWVLIDLKSRNGTRIGEQQVTRHILEDGEVIRIGQTRVCFRAGAFVAAKAPPRVPSRARPLDPHEAMAATMTGMDFAAEAEIALPGFPIPQPKAAEPKAFQQDGVRLLVSKIASGAWDSRLANQALARRPAQVLPWPEAKPSASIPSIEMKKDSQKNLASFAERKPARWLVIAYIFMASGVFAGSMCAIVWPRI